MTRLRGIHLLLVAALALASVGDARADHSRPSFCDPTDVAVNDGHGDEFHQAYPQSKQPLSDDECEELGGLLTEAEDFALRLSTVAEARAAGWSQIAPYIAGQGVHYEAPWGGGAYFNPGRPRYLLYDGEESDAQLAGMMFLQHGERPPSGFPGDNDHWHNHPMLCFDSARTFVLAEHITEEGCQAQGGKMVDSSDLWMVHVWLPVYDGWRADDIFNRSHPSLGESGGHHGH